MAHGGPDLDDRLVQLRPHLADDELGLMYKLPDGLISLDQYGSLHYGWPGHHITDAPVVVGVNHNDHNAFALTTYGLCELVIRPFQRAISAKRGTPTRIDLGELDFDEDIHGEQIRAQEIYECYAWIRRYPDVVGSATFYELTDKGGLGLFRQREYGNLTDLSEGVPAQVYRQIMTWGEFQPAIEPAAPLPVGATKVELRWTSASDAVGLSVALDPAARTLDLRERYWRRIVFIDARGVERYVHTDAQRVDIPASSASARVFALPPDGRNNAANGYTRTVPVPIR
jgi:hypothetical protein